MMECIDTTKVKLFQQAMLDYWECNGRKNLPWRLTHNPWYVLLAEILLRKTTSLQVARVYESLTNLSLEQLRNMNEAELEDILRPLGMYRVRARQINTLTTVLSELDHRSLNESVIWENLPSIGRYARSTVLCFAFGVPKPALDTNMIRVIGRVFGIESNRSRAREDKKLWEFAETLVPQEKCREFNWGVLDFANAVCMARKPKHDVCPLRTICVKLRDSESEH